MMRGKTRQGRYEHGLSALLHDGITTCYRAVPALNRWIGGLLAVLAVVCLVSAVVRWSFLPLTGLPFLAFAGYALRRVAATVDARRAMLRWSIIFLLTFSLGFWIMSIVSNYFNSD